MSNEWIQVNNSLFHNTEHHILWAAVGTA